MADTSAVFAVLNALRPTREGGSVVRSHPLSGRDVLALLVVADRAGKLDGACTASLPVLAATAGLSRASMQRAIASLVACGWLARTPKGREEPDHLRVLDPPKRYQPETSHAETSQPETSHVGAQEVSTSSAKRYQPETQSTPLSTPEALQRNPPTPHSVGALVVSVLKSQDGTDNGRKDGNGRRPRRFAFEAKAEARLRGAIAGIMGGLRGDGTLGPRPPDRALLHGEGEP